MNFARPLDLLNALKNSLVVVTMKDHTEYKGTLIAFDIHINIVLEEKGKKPKFIRGDLIKHISEED